MAMITECKLKGINRKRTCKLLQIDERRVRDWFTRKSLVDSKPGPINAPHALLPEERAAIVVLAKDERYVDDSHRVLTAKCVDSGAIAVSASTVYNVMRSEELTTDRSGHSHRNGNSRKPDRPEITEQNRKHPANYICLQPDSEQIFLLNENRRRNETEALECCRNFRSNTGISCQRKNAAAVLHRPRHKLPDIPKLDYP